MLENSLTFNSVDFLPTSYRDEGLKHRAKLWRTALVVLFGGVIVATSVYQERLHRLAATKFDKVAQRHSKTITLTRQLSELQIKLQQARANAELLTYLRHPWPRTRILASVFTHLPYAITLTELHIESETPPKPPAPISANIAAPDPNAVVKVPLPAESDLAKLREERDAAFWVVTLQGTTTEAAALHEFLARLGRESLFTKVELGSISSSTNTPGASQFSVRLLVRPGYGQPGGPDPAHSLARKSAAHSKNQVQQR